MSVRQKQIKTLDQNKCIIKFYLFVRGKTNSINCHSKSHRSQFLPFFNILLTFHFLYLLGYFFKMGQNLHHISNNNGRLTSVLPLVSNVLSFSVLVHTEVFDLRKFRNYANN